MTSVSKPVRSRAGVWIRLAVALVAAMVATLAGHGTAAFATPSSAATTADVSSAKRSAASYDGTPSHVIASQAARTRTDERTTLQLSRIVIIGLRAAASGAVVAAETAGGLRSLSRADDFGIWPFRTLRADIQGSGLEAHHLIEQRFARVMGQNVGDMASIAVTRAEHQVFTNAWRAAIPYGPQGTRVATRMQVEDAARRIYADYPDILKALGL